MLRFLFIITLLAFVGCKPKDEKQETKGKEYYTCSMHPQVKKDEPGKCPICQMELQPVTTQENTTSDEIKLNDLQIQLGNIKTDTLHKGNIGESNSLVAVVNTNMNKTNSISSRVMGRIEKLYFKTKGDYINEGEKLYDIYSEDLNIIKQQYLLALQKKSTPHNDFLDVNQLIESAKNKLLLYGITKNQLKDISASPTTTIFNSASGYITDLDIKEGDYVMQGEVIFKMADLSSLWVEAQVYPTQLKNIYKEAGAVVTFPDFPEKSYTGKIDFINPELNNGTQLDLIRIEISNKDLLIKPGMAAIVNLNHHIHKAFILPIDAVIRDNNGAIVWVQTSTNTYKSRMVETGIESGDKIEITSGLSEGDIVVMSGAYLLNSEFIFKKGKKNSMEGMEGMKM
ncbi:MAG: efflux RND transporter periplasmic adaptor subunit [Bacteroidia bacterium]